MADPKRTTARDIPRAQRRPTRRLAQRLIVCDSREEALFRAHTESGLTMSAIAEEFRLSVSRISRLIARDEGGKRQALTLSFLARTCQPFIGSPRPLGPGLPREFSSPWRAPS